MALQQVYERFNTRYSDDLPFPSDDIDPKEKKGEWCRQWAEAIFSLFVRGRSYSTIDDIEKIRLLRLYGAGKQPKSIYMDWLLDDVNKNPNRTGYYSTNWDILSVAPKFKKIIRGRFEGQEFDYVATAIDPTSSSKKEDIMWENYYKSQFGKDEQEVMAAAGAPQQAGQVEYIAKSLEELEMFNSIGGFKLKQEIEIENALRYTDYISDMKEIKRKFIDDLVDINKSAFRDYYDPIKKVVRYEYVDWANLIIDYSKENNFKDARFWGYIKFFTINEVRSRRPDLKESDLIGLASQYAGFWGNPSEDYINTRTNSGYRNKDGILVYNQFRVPVLICEWLSNDTRYKMLRKNSRGETLYYEQEERGKIYDTEKRKTVVVEGANVYTCSWIIGTNEVFEDGVAMNAARVNKKTPQLGIHAYALPGTSIIESIIPNLDQIQLTNIKLQSANAEAAPNGLKIEIGALSNINLGDGDKKPIELIKMYRQRGDIIYKATTHAGKYNAYATPIEPIKGGIGPYLDEAIKMFEMQFNFISEISGIDRFTAISKKPGETSATEVNASTASTTDALQPLFTGYINAKEDAANSAACRIQMAVKYNPEAYEAYMPILGKTQLEIMKITKDVVPSVFGIKIEVKPTQTTIQRVIESATAALQPGRDGDKLTFPDWLLICRMAEQGNLKQAEAILTYRLELSRDRALKMQQENMAENRKTAVVTEDAKMKSELTLIQAREKEIRITEILKAALDLQKGESAQEHEAKMSVINTLLPQVLQSALPQQQQNVA